MNFGLLGGSFGFHGTAWQWQPTLTDHADTRILTILDVPPVGGGGQPPRTMMLFRQGRARR